MNTRIHYLYRDASNYKIWGEVIVSGRVSRDDFTRHCQEGDFFLPEEVGLPLLRNEFSTEGFCSNEDDHEWHELIELEETNDEANCGGVKLCAKKS